jgi:glutamate synthase (NADPH/NADH) small chain
MAAAAWCFEILPQPPAGRAPENPWPQWPKVYRLDYGQEEAAATFGDDPRRYCVMSKRFVADAEGQLQGIHTVEIEWVSDQVHENARLQPRELPGSEKFWPAQMILLAMGFVGPEKEGLLAQLEVKLDGRGNVALDLHAMTSVPGVLRQAIWLAASRWWSGPC